MGLILQSVLGGVASEFAEIQDWMFKFTAFSREVGLFIYKLGVVTNSIFKISFNMWNEHGMSLANSFISSSLGATSQPWVLVLSKKDKRNFAEVARSSSFPPPASSRLPLSGSNA